MAGLSRCDQATGDLESAERRYTDAVSIECERPLETGHARAEEIPRADDETRGDSRRSFRPRSLREDRQRIEEHEEGTQRAHGNGIIARPCGFPFALAPDAGHDVPSNEGLG